MIAVAAVVCVLAVGTVVDARASVDQLTLEQQVGQLVVLSFSGTIAPPYVLDAMCE